MPNTIVNYNSTAYKVVSPDPDATAYPAAAALNSNVKQCSDDVATLTTAVGTKATTAALTAHTSNVSNPHSTTAVQVGAYTTSQADTLLSGKSNTGHVHAGTDITTGTVADA